MLQMMERLLGNTNFINCKKIDKWHETMGSWMMPSVLLVVIPLSIGALDTCLGRQPLRFSAFFNFMSYVALSRHYSLHRILIFCLINQLLPFIYCDLLK
jgi:hypothetical protein